MNAPRGGRQQDPSDMFSVAKPAELLRPMPSTLPPSPEERRQRRLIRLAIVVAILIAAAIIAWRVIEYRYQASLDEAAEKALLDGRARSLDAAVRIAADARTESQRALHGLLLGVATLEHGREAENARAALMGIDASELDAKIGKVYLLLEARELQRAKDAAEAIGPADARPVEAHRARALAKAAVGEIQAALEHARAAASAAPSSPRHAVTLAILGAMVGDAP